MRWTKAAIAGGAAALFAKVAATDPTFRDAKARAGGCSEPDMPHRASRSRDEPARPVMRPKKAKISYV